MASPVLTKALARLRADFDTAFPGRDHRSDGWIGDDAHQEHTSGHNPDDTPGSKSEYTDSDSIAEVRAIDVDDDLGNTQHTMQDVVDRILATPADTDRLMYVIYNRTEYSRSNDFRPEPYHGESPHEEHAHFSGDPAQDDNDAPWSVASMGEDEDLNATQDHMLTNTYYGMFNGGTSCGEVVGEAAGDEYGNSLFVKLDYIIGKLREVESKVDALTAAK